MSPKPRSTTCCVKNPNPPSPQRTRQSITRPLHTQSLSRPSFWVVGQKSLGRIVNTQEGVRLPDNPVFSQAGLRVDPNPHFAGSGGRESKMSGPVGPLARHTMLNLSTGHGHSLSTQLLFGRHCALTEVRSNTFSGRNRLSDERCTNSAVSPRQVLGCSKLNKQAKPTQRLFRSSEENVAALSTGQRPGAARQQAPAARSSQRKAARGRRLQLSGVLKHRALTRPGATAS